MKILKSFIRFISNGADVFREASKGQYHRESDEISKIKSELFSIEKQSDDKTKLIEDRISVEKDMCKAWNKIVLGNG